MTTTVLLVVYESVVPPQLHLPVKPPRQLYILPNSTAVQSSASEDTTPNPVELERSRNAMGKSLPPSLPLLYTIRYEWESVTWLYVCSAYDSREHSHIQQIRKKEQHFLRRACLLLVSVIIVSLESPLLC